MDYYSLKKEEAIKQLDTTIKGLSQREAESRLKKFGRNTIDDSLKINKLKILFQQLNSVIIYILFSASLISFFINHILDGVLILCVIILDSGIGYFQQYKAEKAILELKKLMTPYAKVFRDGKLKKINSEEIVPGDLLFLEEGDHIVADCRILSLENLEVNEAILTGESLPVVKEESVLKNDTILAERKNMLFSGTSVIKGDCKCLVTATGQNSEFGKIASMLENVKQEPTNMQKKLDKFAKQISIAVIGIALIILAVGIFSGFEIYDILLTSVAIAVAAIPEGLPAVITLGLAFAAKNMAKNNVIVRRLAASESLGDVTIICSDKTGTITEEKLNVTKLFCNNKFLEKKDNFVYLKNSKMNIDKEKEIYQLIKTSVLCNNARFEIKEESDGELKEEYDIIGDPTEGSLVLSALNLGLNKKILTEEEPRLKEIPFSSQRKMMSVVRGNSRLSTVYSKGATSEILKRSSFELVNGAIVKLTDNRKKELTKISEKLESEALRVLAFAYRNANKSETEFEHSFIFLGFMGMQDTPRKEVKQSILSCLNAGIKVKMLTGDSVITATEIAKQVGIKGRIISGHDLEIMPDNILLEEIDSISVFARISPQQKLRIVEILKLKGENVAITGDGVNDSLALKKADIGIAMGIRGSDVAREVSDMVLTDDNFASIVKAIEEGRTVYDNTKKITKFLLSVNFSEMIIILLAIIMRLPLPLLPVHILWMNLMTDSIPALALTKEKGENVMSRTPRRENSIISGIIPFIILAGTMTFISAFSVFIIGLNMGYEIEKVRTMVLTEDIIYELLFIFVCRSDKSILKNNPFSNKYLLSGVLISIFLQLALIYTPLSEYFRLAPLGLSEWIIILPFAFSGLVIFECYKLFKKK